MTDGDHKETCPHYVALNYKALPGYERCECGHAHAHHADREGYDGPCIIQDCECSGYLETGVELCTWCHGKGVLEDVKVVNDKTPLVIQVARITSRIEKIETELANRVDSCCSCCKKLETAHAAVEKLIGKINAVRSFSSNLKYCPRGKCVGNVTNCALCRDLKNGYRLGVEAVQALLEGEK